MCLTLAHEGGRNTEDYTHNTSTVALLRQCDNALCLSIREILHAVTPLMQDVLTRVRGVNCSSDRRIRGDDTFTMLAQTEIQRPSRHTVAWPLGPARGDSRPTGPARVLTYSMLSTVRHDDPFATRDRRASHQLN